MRAAVVAIVVVVTLRLHAYADATDDAALLHLDRGIAAFDAKDFPTAERELSIAHELAPTKANPYRWLALAEIQLGDCTSALPHIDGFLSRVGPDDARIAEMTRWRAFCVRSMQPPPPPPRDEAKPVRSHWWFWPAVGLTAVAVTGVTVYAFTHTSESTLPPVRFP
jgi:hypothetical protein